MSTATENIIAHRIVQSVRAAFPEDAEHIDAIMLRDGFDHDAHFIWLERFSRVTTDAIKQREFTWAAAQLNLISNIIAGGDERTVRCIDVAYVESLMWDIKDQKLKREGWKLIPANLRALYVAMWGEQVFVKGKAHER